MIRTRHCRYLLLVLATDPSDATRQRLQHWADENHVFLDIWGKSHLDRLAENYPRLRAWLYNRPYDRDSIEERYYDHFYHLGPNFAAAFRLVGASDECFSVDTVHVTSVPDRYSMPAFFQLHRDRVVEILEEEARTNNTLFYNGPHTRLIDYRVTPVEASEQKHLTLKLGPVSWYDYSVVNQELIRTFSLDTFSKLSPYVPFDVVAKDGAIRDVKLTNILVVLASVVTSDGFILYSQRSARLQAYQHRLISAVSENIHQEKDQIFNPTLPGQPPVPFRTVLRGIGEELSEKLCSGLNPRSILLLGLSFHTETFHPSLLFLVPLTHSLEEVREICREDPGKDFIEGTLHPAPALRSSWELRELLSQPTWIPAGKASLIRAIEFLDAIRLRTGLGVQDVIKALANATLP